MAFIRCQLANSATFASKLKNHSCIREKIFYTEHLVIVLSWSTVNWCEMLRLLPKQQIQNAVQVEQTTGRKTSFVQVPNAMQLQLPMLKLQVIKIAPKHIHQSLHCLTLLSFSKQWLFSFALQVGGYGCSPGGGFCPPTDKTLLCTFLLPKPPPYLLCIPVQPLVLVVLNAV